MIRNYNVLYDSRDAISKNRSVKERNLSLTSFASKKEKPSMYLGWLVAFLLMFGLSANAQVSGYAFSESAGTYAPITGGTVVATATTASGAGSLDDTIFNLPSGTIPFPFTYDGVPYTGLNISTNGFVAFGATPPAASGTGTGYNPISGTTAYAGAISVFGGDNNSLFNILGNTGQIRYETVGVSPNQEFVIQWSNFRPFSTSTSTTLFWRWNYQIRLHENGTINMDYDANFTGAAANLTRQVGLRGPNNTFATNVKNRLITTGTHTWNTSVVGTTNASTCAATVANIPVSGKRFTFTPPPPPACTLPNTIVVTQLTPTTASVSWAGAATAVVEWGATGCVAGTGNAAGACGNVLATVSSPQTITGLVPGTVYSVHIRQDCTGSANGFSLNNTVSYTAPLPGESCVFADFITVAPNLGASVNTLLTTGATSDGPNGTCSDGTGNPSKKDRWVKFVAPSSGNKIIVTTSGGTITDAVMQVWSSCPATGTALGCSDDQVGLMPELSFCQNQYTPGATYYVQIWPYSATATGNYNVKIYEDVACATPPSNDECAGVETIIIGVAGSCPANNISGTTTDATATAGVVKTTCDAFGTYLDVFYKFNSGSNTEVNFEFTNGSGSNEFGIYSGCGTGFLGVCSSTDFSQVITGLTINTDYYIVVWANNVGASGSFELCISQIAAPECISSPISPVDASTVCAGTTNFSWAAAAGATTYDVFLDTVLVSDDQVGTSYSQSVTAGAHTWSIVPSNSAGAATGCVDFTFTASVAPAGDVFADAIDLGIITASTNASGDNQTSNCWHNDYTSASTPGDTAAKAGNDVFYKFEITECASTLDIGTCTSSFDTFIHLLDSTGTNIDGDDDSCTSPNSSGSLITGLALTPGIYYVVVEGFGAADMGTFTLDFNYTSGLVPFYQDADGDGFGNPAVTILACVAPVGYVALGTDCNDAVASINPGAVDVCLDGIDNDCNGNIDNVGLPGGCIPVLTTLPTATCGSTISGLSVTITATYVVGAQGYRFRVKNLVTNAIQIVDRPVNSFALSNLPGITLGTPYEIDVALKFAGVWQPFFGAACTVNTPSPLCTIGAQCATTLTSMTQFVYCNFVSSVTGYRFRVTDTSTSAIQIYNSGLNRFNFNSLPARSFGTVYFVEVALRNTDGTYLPYSVGCNITTPAFPTSELVLSQCDYTALSNTQSIGAVLVSGATEYRFNLSNISQPYTFSIDRPVPNFTLSMFPGLTPGTTYSVQVAVKIGGVFGPLTGKICNLTTPGGTRVNVDSVSNIFNVVSYPNPFAENFMLNVKTSSESTLQVSVYDMLGRQVENSNVEVSEIENIQIGSNYPSGVYNVIVSQEGNTQTLRVIKR